MKKYISIIITLSATISSFAYSDTKEKAIELMNTMEIRKNIDASMAQVLSFSEQMIESQDLDPKAKEAAKGISRKSMQATIDTMKAIEWEGIFADIYTEFFSEEEIQGLIEFYKSPLGRKLMEKQPQIMTATMTRLQGEMSKFMPQIQQATMQAIEEVKAESEDEVAP